MRPDCFDRKYTHAAETTPPDECDTCTPEYKSESPSNWEPKMGTNCSTCKHKDKFSTSDRCKECRAAGYEYKVFYSLWESDSTDSLGIGDLGASSFDLEGFRVLVDKTTENVAILLGEIVELHGGMWQVRAEEALENLCVMQKLLTAQPEKSCANCGSTGGDQGAPACTPECKIDFHNWAPRPKPEPEPGSIDDVMLRLGAIMSDVNAKRAQGEG